MDTKSIVISGVGGQGTILASEIISDALFLSGFDVKKNEIHGMSQRGGSVVSFIRFGDEVLSPIVNEAESDIILAFEKLEALRNLHFLKKDGYAVVSDITIDPIPVLLGTMSYPENFDSVFNEYTSHLTCFDPVPKAKQAGNLKTSNVVMIGALSIFLPEVELAVWLKSLENRVKPEFLDVNKKAFELGRNN